MIELPKQNKTQELTEMLKQNKLTKREIEVIFVAIKGLKHKEMALELGVITQTIKFHMTNIYRKLGIKKKKQLIKLCNSYIAK